MICNNGNLKNKNRCCKFYFSRTYIADGNIIEEHFCGNGFITEIAEASERYDLINLENRVIKTCSIYLPLRARKKHKTKKNKINGIWTIN